MAIGSHTMGKARCLSFKQRIHDDSIEESIESLKRDKIFEKILRSICPESGHDDALAPLDYMTSARFDNYYYQNILQGKGLLQTDNVLITQDLEGEIRRKAWSYASDQQLFFSSFVKSMVKMGSINVLTGNQGEIRRHCRFVNSNFDGF